MGKSPKENLKNRIQKTDTELPILINIQCHVPDNFKNHVHLILSLC